MKTLNDTSGERVTLRELANSLGYAHHSDGELLGIMRGFGVDIEAAVAPNWHQHASVPVEVAAEAFGLVLAAQQANDAKHLAYQRYLNDRADAAQRERDAASERRREEERQQAEQRRQMSEERRAEAERKALERMRDEEAARMKRRGSPVSFADFAIPDPAS